MLDTKTGLASAASHASGAVSEWSDFDVWPHRDPSMTTLRSAALLCFRLGMKLHVGTDCVHDKIYAWKVKKIKIPFFVTYNRTSVPRLYLFSSAQLRLDHITRPRQVAFSLAGPVLIG